jgi:hypothetical protein
MKGQLLSKSNGGLTALGLSIRTSFLLQHGVKGFGGADKFGLEVSRLSQIG